MKINYSNYNGHIVQEDWNWKYTFILYSKKTN